MECSLRQARPSCQARQRSSLYPVRRGRSAASIARGPSGRSRTPSRRSRSAGYLTTGLLTPTKQDLFIGPDATPEYLDALKTTIAASGVKAIMGSLRSRHDIPIEETIKSLHKQIDNAAFLGLESVITFGTDNADQVDHYLKSMADAAAYGQEKNVKVVMKPHGGSSGASEEIVASMKKVDNPNFKNLVRRRATSSTTPARTRSRN